MFSLTVIEVSVRTDNGLDWYEDGVYSRPIGTITVDPDQDEARLCQDLRNRCHVGTDFLPEYFGDRLGLRNGSRALIFEEC